MTCLCFLFYPNGIKFKVDNKIEMVNKKYKIS